MMNDIPPNDYARGRNEAREEVREFLFKQYQTSKKAADVLDELEKFLLDGKS